MNWFSPIETLKEILTNGQAFAALVRASEFTTRICPHVSRRARALTDEAEEDEDDTYE